MLERGQGVRSTPTTRRLFPRRAVLIGAELQSGVAPGLRRWLTGDGMDEVQRVDVPGGVLRVMVRPPVRFKPRRPGTFFPFRRPLGPAADAVGISERHR